MHIHPVILIGGSGTRLWPLSRPGRPKQFLPLVSDRSMLVETIERVVGRTGFTAPILVSGEQHLDVLGDVPGMIEPAALLVEPEARNTAPAIAMAAHWIVQRHGDGLMLVMPSDHVIADVSAFHEKLAMAKAVAEAGHLVTFGIKPDHPATGYGYIEAGRAVDEDHGIFRVLNFVEKPPLERAEQYLADGRYHWNAGIFLFTARSFLQELVRHAPAVADPIARAMAMATADQDGIVVRPDEASFLNAANQSIDYAVMEKTDSAVVVPVDIGWSDVGSWDALWAACVRDGQGNSIRGPVVSIDNADNLLLVAGGPPIAALGVKNSVVVSTADVVLVLPRERSQDVKRLIDAFHEARL